MEPTGNPAVSSGNAAYLADTDFEPTGVGNDVITGRNARRFRAKFKVLSAQMGLDSTAAWSWYAQLNKNPQMDQKATADALTIDWTGLLAFIEALAPIIEEMIENCGA